MIKQFQITNKIAFLSILIIISFCHNNVIGGSTDNCYQYNLLNPLSCDICLPNYYPIIDRTQCKQCSVIISDCAQCYYTASTPTKCSSCLTTNKYPFSQNSACKYCNVGITYCQLCQTSLTNNQTYCLNCSSPYFPTIEKSQCKICSQIIANCSTCYVDQYDNYKTKCFQCQNLNNIFLKPDKSKCGLCSQVILYCRICQGTNLRTATSCTSCQTGTMPNLLRTQCILCQTILPFCLICSGYDIGNSVCSKCSTNYYLSIDNKKCQLCSEAVLYCSQCTSSQDFYAVCVNCTNGLYPFLISLNNYKCKVCNDQYPKCDVCEIKLGVTYCTNCESNWFPTKDNKGCQYCNTSIPYCSSCIEKTAPDGVKYPICDKCQYNNENLLSRVPDLTQKNCIYCKDVFSVQCLNCHLLSGSYYCDMCGKRIVNGQQVQLYLSQNQQQCKLCNQLIQNCIQCSYDSNMNLLFCSLCISSQYVYDYTSKKCIACSEKYSNCVQCSSTGCSKCQQYQYLINNAVCETCSYFINQCLQCEASLGKTVCLKCNENVNKYPDSQGFSCVLCQNSIQNCTSCSYQIGNIGKPYVICSQCYPQMSLYPSLNKKSCQICPNIQYCVQCPTNPQICKNCQGDSNILLFPTFPLDSSPNSCEICSNIITNCNSCQIISDFQAGVDKQTRCIQCINNNNTPTSMTLFVFNNMKQCKKCDQIIENCNSCFDQGSNSFTLNKIINLNILCQQCQVTYYLNYQNKKQCKPCSFFIENCIQCTQNTNINDQQNLGKVTCTKCSDDKITYLVQTQNKCLACSQKIQNCKRCQLDQTTASQICLQCNNNPLDNSLLYPNQSKTECVSCQALLSQIPQQQLDCYKTSQGCSQYFKLQCLKGISSYQIQQTQTHIQQGAIILIAIPAILLIGIIGSSIVVFKKISGAHALQSQILSSQQQLANLNKPSQQLIVRQNHSDSDQKLVNKIDQLGFMFN